MEFAPIEERELLYVYACECRIHIKHLSQYMLSRFDRCYFDELWNVSQSSVPLEYYTNNENVTRVCAEPILPVDEQIIANA